MERKKIAVLIVSVALVVLMGGLITYLNFSDSWSSAKTPDITKVSTKPAGSNVEAVLLQKNDRIISNLSYLEQLDMEHAFWPDDSAKKDKQLLTTLIQSVENNVRLLIDSLEDAGNEIPTKYGRIQGNMKQYYSRILENRMMSETEIVAAKATLPEGALSNVRTDMLEFELLKKDELIMDLNQKLTSAKEISPVKKDTNQVLQAYVNYNAEKEKQYDNLRERYEILQKEYQQAMNKVSRAEAKPEQVDNMKNKVEELEAALRMAEVNCNLMRADAKEIIYNSRQRKALLEESLSILRNLSSSTNASVQKQAKEKLSELKTIAATIRD